MPEHVCGRVVYLGMKGSAIALDRATGQELWSTRLTGGDFVNILLDDDVVLATTKGEVFCLDAKSGAVLWQNRLPGRGIGIVTIATTNGSTVVDSAFAQSRKDEQTRDMVGGVAEFALSCIIP